MAGSVAVDRALAGRAVGVVAGVTGLAASLYVLFGPDASYERVAPDGSTTSATVSGIDYLGGAPGAELALFAWPLFLGAVAAVGAAAWHRLNRWTWSAASVLGAFTVVGGFSIGLLAPAAGLLLAAALIGRK